MSHNDYQNRTAGGSGASTTIQAWKSKKAAPLSPSSTSQNDILANLEKAQKGKIGRFDSEVRTAALAYAPQTPAPSGAQSDFKFGDVVDIVNPLHHLPIVGMVYRGLTDDKIGPMAQIIGGAAFGGPIGAVTGTINAVTQIQTGKDVGDHVMEFSGLKTGLKNERSFEDVISRYEKVDLDNMPKRDKIQSFNLNS